MFSNYKKCPFLDPDFELKRPRKIGPKMAFFIKIEKVPIFQKTQTLDCRKTVFSKTAFFWGLPQVQKVTLFCRFWAFFRFKNAYFYQFFQNFKLKNPLNLRSVCFFTYKRQKEAYFYSCKITAGSVKPLFS